MNATPFSFNFLLSKILTTEDITFFLKHLETWQRQQFTTSEVTPEVAETAPYHQVTLLNQLWDAYGQANPQATIKNLIAAVREYLESLTTIEVTLCYSPTTSQVKDLCSFLRSHLEPTIVLTIITNPQISGGCIVACNGHQYDLSLRHAVSLKYDQQRQKFN